MATSSEKKYSVVCVKETSPYSYGGGAEGAYIIDGYTIFTNGDVIIDSHINTNPNIANKQFKYTCTLPFKIKISFITASWYDSNMYNGEFDSVCFL